MKKNVIIEAIDIIDRVLSENRNTLAATAAEQLRDCKRDLMRALEENQVADILQVVRIIGEILLNLFR